MGVAVFPFCSLAWGQTTVGVMVMAISFKSTYAWTVVFSALDLMADHCWPMPLLETPGHSQASLGQSLVGSLLLSPESWCTQGSICALQESVSPVLCKFWWLYGGVNGDHLQEGLCHIQVCCTQSPCPYSRPLLTHTSAGDIQTQFCLSLCEHLWCVCGFILNVILPLLPSFWGFSFALGCGVSPHNHFSVGTC